MKISELLSNERKKKINQMELDVLRILTAVGGNSWKTELSNDIEYLQNFKEEPGDTGDELLDNAIEELEKEDFVESEKRTKATKEGKGEEWMISLKDPIEVRKSLSGDKVLNKYIYERAPEPK